MKRCPHCDISVEGEGQFCPLCQNELEGEGSRDPWPYAVKLKKQSLLFKIQFFVMVSAAVICVSLDFLMGFHGKEHWSLIVLACVIAVQLTIRHIFKTWYNLSRAISISVFYMSVLLMVIFAYTGYWDVFIFFVMPILWTLLMIADLVLVLIDRSGNAMVYLLIVFLVNILFFGIAFSVKRQVHMVWSICLTITAVALIGLFVFRGKGMIREIRKRLSM